MKGSRASSVRAFCLSALALAACSHARPADDGSPADASSPAVHAVVDAEVAPLTPAVDAGAATVVASVDALPAYAAAAPLGGRSVGHTSVVFKLKLEGDLAAAYKPRSARGHERYKGEIAAYRLARALQLDNVPPAIPRAFSYDALKGAVGGEPIFADVVPGDDGQVRGALIPWIKGLELLPLDKEGEVAKWRAWLRQDGALPDDQRALAAQISTMLAFDMVTGNWDRWSGGNIGVDRSKNEVLFIDNDGAFFDPVPVKVMKRGDELFHGVDRFSKRFVAALRAVDLKRAFAEEAPGAPLLSDRVIRQTDARRRAVIASIDAKIGALGESAVLVFP